MHYLRVRELMLQWGADHGQRLHMKDLAARTGISAGVLSKMASPGGYVTTTRHVEALCRFFGVPPTELFHFRLPIDPGAATSWTSTPWTTATGGPNDPRPPAARFPVRCPPAHCALDWGQPTPMP